MTTSSRHALIIGGGLAGPCLALCLAGHNIRSTIFEIRPTRSDSGGSISLGPHALQVLARYTTVYERIRAVGFSYHRFGAYTDDGEKLGEIVVGDESKGKEGARIILMRSTLHKILLDACDESGMVEIKWGAKMLKIEEDEKSVTAYFQDGTEATGDILIGADGIHSKVREHVLGSQAPTTVYDNTCFVYGFLPSSSAITPSPEFTFPSFMFTPSGWFVTIPHDHDGKTLTWGIQMTVSQEKTREEWREFEVSGEAARLAKADYADVTSQPLRSLLDHADDTEARTWAQHILPDLPSWHTPRVCLMGDAAHALPANGQGSAMAFEDAAILTRLLTSESKIGVSYEDLFRQFEVIRRPRIQGLRESSAVLKAKTGPWIWYMKKWVLRTLFWFKSGVIDNTKETQYDVDEVAI
ncbi:putative kynurenine 3-monooxygenase [Mycena amicta]|nr:putative kynurenine 3-monooxygenase [Mycena amicta]